MTNSVITRTGLRLVGVPDEPLLVFFEDQYIWSFTPSRDGVLTGEDVEIDWPRALVPFLKGSTRVRVATFDTTIVVYDDEVAFDDSDARVSFVDDKGAPYSIDKVGHLARAFEETSSDVKAELIEASKMVLDALKERCGVDGYLCYGALLGAVRQGTMLGHDSDVDLCYFSTHTNPTDLIIQSHKIQRELRGLGWIVIRMSAADIKVVWPLSDGRMAHIDIFSAFRIPDSSGFAGGGTFYQFGNRNGSFDVEANLMPLGTIELEGVEFPAPKNPEAMLAFIYGENWRVPDPGFRYQDSPVGTRRLDGWFRGFRTEVPYWLPVFSSPTLEQIPEGPSDFARWVEPQTKKGARIVDLGAGNGRDTFWFAEQGHRVLAMDFSRPAITKIRRRRSALDQTRVSIDQAIFNEERTILPLIVDLQTYPGHLYARGLIGSLDEDARRVLFRTASAALRGQNALFLEFSALVEGKEYDMPEPKGLTRRFDVSWLTREIEEYGGVIEYVDVSEGEDMFGNVDPAVARMRIVFPPPVRN